MPTEDSELGRGSGFSVEEDSDNGYRWSAFGPAGTRQGHAESREEAEAAARGAEEALSRSRRGDA
jgi:hypothetical protein